MVDHYMLMKVFGFVVIGTGLLVSLHSPGWLVAAWVTGLAVAVNGVGWIVYPEFALSPGLIWGVAAIAWVIVFVAIATRTQYTEAPIADGTPGDTTTSER